MGNAWSRYSAAVVVRAASTAPRSVSWCSSGCPTRCAPTTAKRNGRVASCDSVGAGSLSASAWKSCAGVCGPDARTSVEASAAVSPAASSSSPPSAPPGATNDTPNGSPLARCPAGAASAASPSGFTNAVSRPSSTLGPTGSASASAKVGGRATVGTTRASTRDHHPFAAASRWAQSASPALDHLRRVEVARSFHDGEHGGIDRVAVLERELSERGEALGEECAAVEERAGVVHRARRPPPRRCIRAPRAARRARSKHRRASSSPSQSIGAGTPTRIGGWTTSAPGTLHTAYTERGVGRVGDEHRHAVERAHGRDDTLVGEHARRRLGADHAAQRRRDATRACGVGAECERDLTGGDHDRGTGARSARDQRVVERVAAGPVAGRAGADQPGGELVEVGLAREHRARSEELLDHRRRARGDVRELFAPGGRRDTRDVDVVLHRERHAGEREVVAGRERGVDLGRARPEVVGGRLADPGRGLR